MEIVYGLMLFFSVATTSGWGHDVGNPSDYTIPPFREHRV